LKSIVFIKKGCPFGTAYLKKIIFYFAAGVAVLSVPVTFLAVAFLAVAFLAFLVAFLGVAFLASALS